MAEQSTSPWLREPCTVEVAQLVLEAIRERWPFHATRYLGVGLAAAWCDALVESRVDRRSIPDALRAMSCSKFPPGVADLICAADTVELRELDATRARAIVLEAARSAALWNLTDVHWQASQSFGITNLQRLSTDDSAGANAWGRALLESCRFPDPAVIRKRPGKPVHISPIRHDGVRPSPAARRAMADIAKTLGLSQEQHPE